MFHIISTPEEAACRSLLDEKCIEHKDIFDDAAIAAVPSCPCFDADDLDKAAADVASGSYTFYPDPTCKGSASQSNSISYTTYSSGNPFIVRIKSKRLHNYVHYCLRFLMKFSSFFISI